MFHFTYYFFFFFNDPATTDIYTLSLHDALPIWIMGGLRVQIGGVAYRFLYPVEPDRRAGTGLHDFADQRSEEHTSELQSPYDLVCRLLLEKKKKKNITTYVK